MVAFCTTSFLVLGLLAARADIIFLEGNNPEPGDNVLFNDDDLLHEGPLVQGNFAGPGSAFVIEFTSTSGDNNLVGDGGQARLEGAEDNDPLGHVTFRLSDGATFTHAVFNPFQGDGPATITVVEDDGTVHTQEIEDLSNGNNFWTVNAVNGQKIASISIEAEEGFRDLRQVRLGGFEEAPGVPDGGLTLMLLGLSLPALAAARRIGLLR